MNVEYRPPAKADVAEQAAILEAAIASRPSGITIDLLDGPMPETTHGCPFCVYLGMRGA